MYLFTPLEQFQVQPLAIPIPMTNGSLLMVIAIGLVTLLFYSVDIKRRLVPTRWQWVLENYYQNVLNIVLENMGGSAQHYFPFLITLFTYILVLNLLGLIPYSYAVTAQIVITFGLSLSIWQGALYTGIGRYKADYAAMYMPNTAPVPLSPLLVVIELLSYVARAVSLGVRLAANITSGHILLAIIASFGWTMLLAGGLLAIAAVIPVGVLLFLMALEIAVGLVQAYVFTLLTAIYLNDGLHLH